MPRRPAAPSPRRNPLRVLFTFVLHLAWTALVVVVPLLAAWVASSLAAHAGGSTRVAAASGLLVFPIVPLLWELLSSRRRNPAARPVLTRWDRIVLRTLALSVLLIGGLLLHDPRRAFVALNARGDWMLDGHHEPAAESARRGLFWLAGRSEWLYHLTDDNPFSDHGHHPPTPQPLPDQDVTSTPAHGVVAATEPTHPTPTPAPERAPHAWPWPADQLHAAVRALTPADETSPEAVGRFLAAREPDAWELARAVHDYVSSRVAYDVDSYRSGVYPPQDAATTFRTRRSVCAGYAALFEAVGRAAGLTVETVAGRARGIVTTGMGEGHAWNAVKLDDRWYLVDTTWDAGFVDAAGYHPRYGTRYFLTPPAVFFAKHFPDDERWQLMTPALSAGEYMRAPPLDPEFFAQGLHLVSPDRAESDAQHGTVDVVIDNPRGVSVMVNVRPVGGSSTECAVSGAGQVTAHCPLLGRDQHEVVIFTAAERYATHWSVGSLRVHSR